MSALLRPDWPAPASVQACTTLRAAPAGVSLPPFDRFNLGSNCGDEPDHVARNRAVLRRMAALPAEPHWLKQVHGTRVLRFAAAAAAPAAAQEADAAVTSDAGVVLAILTADCLPVLLCSRDGGELGAAHAGWRGLAAGVLEATVAAMATPASQLVAWLGPAAGPASYEIGEDVRAAFAGFDEAFVATRPGPLEARSLRRRAPQTGGRRRSGGARRRLRHHRRHGALFFAPPRRTLGPARDPALALTSQPIRGPALPLPPLAGDAGSSQGWLRFQEGRDGGTPPAARTYWRSPAR